MGTKPVITFDRVGEFTSSIYEGEMGVQCVATPIHRCGRCAALVPDGWLGEHVDWHAALSLERWETDDAKPLP